MIGLQLVNIHIYIYIDLVDFYPFISAELLTDALDFAKQYSEIPSNDIEVILHARSSLLFKDRTAWAKHDRNALFDMTLGSHDRAEVCKLVATFLLNKLAESFQKKDMGFYRDDGLSVLKDTPGHDADAARKPIIGIFQWYGLKITIQANLKTTNFLDTSFNLGTGKYRPYRKPNDETMYIHTMSNHPSRILENLPKAIGR